MTVLTVEVLWRPEAKISAVAFSAVDADRSVVFPKRIVLIIDSGYLRVSNLVEAMFGEFEMMGT